MSLTQWVAVWRGVFLQRDVYLQLQHPQGRKGPQANKVWGCTGRLGKRGRGAPFGAADLEMHTLSPLEKSSWL